MRSNSDNYSASYAEKYLAFAVKTIDNIRMNCGDMA